MNTLIIISILLLVYSIVISYNNFFLKKEVEKQKSRYLKIKHKYQVEAFVSDQLQIELDYQNQVLQTKQNHIIKLLNQTKPSKN